MKKTLAALALIVCLIMVITLFASCKPAEVDPIDDNYRVFYQIFVGSFSDSNGDGIGDLRGIINRIDYLNDGNINSGKSLGVQGLWLSPIFKSPSYHKYDATDYYAIDPQFGTEDDLKELIELCHKRNVKVILDLAINHTSKENQWFKNFVTSHQRNNTDSDYYDFYTWEFSDTRLNGHTYYSIPGCANQYYEGNFDSGMPELNYDNDNVRTAVVDVAKHYLEMGIDGFRFDAIKYIYYNDTQDSAEFWKWYMAELRKIKPDVYAVGECWSADGEILEYYEALNCFCFSAAQVSGTIASAAKGQISSYVKHVETFTKKASSINPDSMFIPFLANHDTDRAAGYLPPNDFDLDENGLMVQSKTAYMAANLYLLCSGSPFIYYGEEIGMKGTRGGETTDANRRLAMLWGDKDTVKNPVGSTFSSENQINGTVKSQQRNKNSLLNYYARVIQLRNKYPQIARGSYTAVTVDSTCAGFVIEYKGEKTLLLHNVSPYLTVTVDLDKLPFTPTTLCDYIGQGKATLKSATLTIKAQTSVILK